MQYDPVAVARQFLFVREAGQNHGNRVNSIQKWGGGEDGQSWCMWFATMVLDLCFQGAAPIPREGSCEAVHQVGAVHGWLTDTPTIGDLVLSINDEGLAHHVGIVTNTDPLTSIAGNTSADGVSANGDGVYEHAISATNKRFVHYPRD
jgi:hypothetical protein